ncbi:hypothetical protein LCGC14_1191410, partial [marine sediment metagenome]
INWIDWVSASSAEVVKVKCTVTDAVTATVSVNHNPIPGSSQESPVDRLELIFVGGANAGYKYFITDRFTVEGRLGAMFFTSDELRGFGLTNGVNVGYAF